MNCKCNQQSPQFKQKGFTLVELMVALVLMSIVILAAVMSVTASSNAFTGLDQSSQLRDNARYATDIMRRIVLQAGYESYDTTGNFLKREAVSKANTGGTIDFEPDVRGFNNTIVSDASILSPGLAHDSRKSNCGSVKDTSCLNGSDALLIRFDGASAIAGNKSSIDGTLINCLGISEVSATEIIDRPINVFHIRRDKVGEPSLYCGYRTADGTMESEVLVSGVETLQVLYGVDSVTPGTSSASITTAPRKPTRYLRADEIDVVDNDKASKENWRRVRTVLVGMVIRGAPNSDRAGTAKEITYYPLGPNMHTTNDDSSAFKAPADNRIRQVVTFTVQLRNDQTLR